MSILDVRNIVKKFDESLVVDEVSFSAEEGEFFTLLGPSGCGKTTLLKLIGGFYAPDGGEILIRGTDVSEVPPEDRDTTMCFQSYALFPHLTVNENIVFGLKQKRLPKPERLERLDEAVNRVDLSRHRKKYPSMLSGGQQQRVALARAIAMRSGIILFDEPLSNLDAKLRDQVRFEIRRLQKEHGFTAVYVTHDQSEALAMSDTILVMNEGRVEQCGKPEEIYHHPKNSFIADFIGTANILPGRVLGKEGATSYRISSSMGELLVHSARPPEAEEILLSWRPEDAVLVSRNEQEREKENSFAALVETAVYQGNLIDLFVNVQGDSARRRIQVLGKADFQEGDSLHFKLSPESISLLEARK